MTADDSNGHRRGRRRRGMPRAVTLAAKNITRASLREFSSFEYAAELDMQRPRTRGDCLPGGCNEQRPCPWVACKFHLFLDVNPETGSIKFNHPITQPWELRDSCSLDVADRGGETLEAVGQIYNFTRERCRQIEVRGLLAIKAAGALKDAG